MTWKHVAVIFVALAAMLACGWQSVCGPHIKDIKEVCLIVLSGTIGNALNGNSGKRKGNEHA